MPHRDDVEDIVAMERAQDAYELYENAPCALIATAMDGTLLRANGTFLRWIGYEEGDLIGRKRFDELLTPGGRIYHETHYAPLLRMQGLAREIAVELVARDGTLRPVLINSTVKHDDAGSPLEIRTALFDAVHRREYERELLRARQRAEESEAQVRILAETLQASLIPPEPPTIPQVDVGAAYRPAGSGAEVGGDFYDVFEFARNEWAVVLGDVMGKGARAATVTALARYTIRAVAIHARSPKLVLGLLNAAMLRQQPDSFCTVAYARVRLRDPQAPRITVTSGGHPLPLLVSRDGSARAVGIPGTVIGVVPEPELYDTRIELASGDVVTFFTDGVTEGRSPAGDFFGDARVEEWVAANREVGAAAIAEGLLDAVVAFQDGIPRDDLAVLVLKVP
jgi:phosphoserine phosphatase RsbU/P